VLVVSSREKFTRDVLLIGLTRVSTALSKLILLPLLTKVLGAYDYGIWSQANITIGLMMVFARAGLNEALSRFLPAMTKREEIQEDFYSVFSVVALLSAIASFPLIVFSEPIGNAFFNGAGKIVRLTGFIIPVFALDAVCRAFFRAFQQMKKYAILNLASIYVELGIVAYLILAKYTIFSILLSILAVRTAFFCVSFCLVSGQIGMKRPRFSRIKEYLGFGVPIIPSDLSSWVVASSDRYIVGYYLGIEQVGVYSAAYGVGSILYLLPGVLAFVLVPTVSRLYDEGKMSALRSYLQYSLKYFLAVGIPFVFGIGMLSKQILRIFSTSEIASQGFLITPLVGLGALLLGVYVIISHILIVVRKTRIMAIIWILAALVNLSLNVLAVPRIGILGAAITTLIAYALALVLVAYYSFKEFTFHIEWFFTLKSLAASAIMSLVIWKIAPKETVAVLLTVALGIVIYAGALYLLKGFNEKEIDFFRRLLQRAS